MKCPKCGGTELRSSRHARWSDAFHTSFGRRAYRCRSCRARFHAAESPESPTAGPELKKNGTSLKHRHKGKLVSKRAGRHLIEAAVVVLMLIVFLVFLRYLTREQSPASEPESGYTAGSLLG